MDVQSDRAHRAGWARAFGRAFAGLWTRLRAALRRWAPAAAGPGPALPPAGARPASVDGVPQDMTQQAPVPPPRPAPAPVQAPISAPVQAPVAAPVQPEEVLVVEEPPAPPARPARKRAEPAVEVAWSPEVGLMRVRQFFGRIVMAAPGAAEVDLGDWERVSVERFFLALGSPRALARREPPTSGGEAMSLGNAFEGFEWD